MQHTLIMNAFMLYICVDCVLHFFVMESFKNMFKHKL